MDDPFRFADALGPRKLVHVWEPSLRLRAVVVVDNVACGPAIGGVRMAPDVSTEEAVRLARAMTLKNSAAGLAHGGGKSVIFGDPRMPAAEKERVIRAFACAIRDLVEYIPGPDMGTDERCMAWMQDEIGRAVGLPPALGGIPLDEIGATGFGLAAAADVAAEAARVRLDGARVAVQGFGAVGKHAARFLALRGARLIAAADSKGTLVHPPGIDVARLIALRAEGKSVVDYPEGEKRAPEAVVDVECEIWIPAARPDVIREANVGRLRARLVLEGANIPITPAAESTLHAKGVLVVPDFIANAGGVICAAVEYHGGTQKQAFEAIEEKIRANTRRVLEESQRAGIPPRAAALALAEERVRAAGALRRFR
jgi:glutamate dehydrogenase/leucine dehydrogenase